MKVVMPQIGMTMQEGTIINILKKDGEHVEKGEDIFEIETEKMTKMISAPISGVFRSLVAVDDSIPCGDEIAEITE